MELGGKPVYIVDIEADDLLDDVTKIHILGIAYENNAGVWKIKTTTDYKTIKELVEKDCWIVGHYFTLYDEQVIKKIIPEVKWKAEIIDSLFLSYTLYDYRNKHGLDDLGKEQGIEKVKVKDSEWKEGDAELMKDRVTKDVKINTNEFIKQFSLLMDLYGNEKDIIRYIRYINNILYTFVEQSENPFTLDIENAKLFKIFLEQEIEKRCSILRKVMPKIPVKSTKKLPSKQYKIDGTMTAIQIKWELFLKECGLPNDHKEEVEYIKSYKEPNPQSVSQVKDWLINHLNWKPCTFVESFNVKGEVNKVPQLKDKEKNLVSSIQKLIPNNPSLKELSDLSIIQHRLGYVKAFLDKQKDNKVTADISKLTASTRAAHRKPIVNLPGVTSDFGEYVRPLLTCEPDKILTGVDISSLENYVAANYTYKYNPEILTQLNDPTFDSHIFMAVYAGMITEEEAEWFKQIKEKKKEDLTNEEIVEKERIAKIRYNAKTTNYSALFGIGKKKLGSDLGITVPEAGKLIDGFWKMNAHIKEFMKKDLKVINLDGRQWVKAPLSGFWLPLRAEHKKFNIVVQHTGMYIFTLWGYYIRKMGWKISLSMHDEYCIIIDPKDKGKIEYDLKLAMNKVNKLFNLAAPISIDVQFGKNYGEIH